MRGRKIIGWRNENGFTLVEALVAIGILSFGLLAVSAMQNTALLGTGKSKSITEATTVAMDIMERVVAMSFDTLTTGYTQDSQHEKDDLPGDPPELPSNIEYAKWKYSNSASLPSDSAKIIEVTVKSKAMKTPIVLKNIKLKIS